MTSPLSSNGNDGGFSICEFHFTQFDLQNKSGEFSEDIEEEKDEGSRVEEDEEMEEDIVSSQSV